MLIKNRNNKCVEMRTEPCLKNLTDKSFGRAPEKQNELLQDLGAPHIDSFNFMLSKGLILAVRDIDEVFFELPNKDRVCLQILDASISSPTVPLGSIGIKNPKIYPTECRQKHTTYNGKLTVTVGWSVNGKSQSTFEKDMGSIPIMIKSDACHLAGISPAELIKHKEHAEEWGGYFIIRGYERLVRMLTMTRRNYPLTLQRSSWRQRGALFSDFGVQIRCVAEDETSTNNVLHFVTNGTAKFMFSHRKNLYYAPVMLIMKSLLECSDQYIYDSLIKSHEEDKNFSVCIQSMLRTLHEDGLHTHEDCKIYIAKMFRHKFWEIPTWANDIEVTDYILKRCVLIHLKSNKDKFNLIVLMTQKLFSFSKGECKVEGADSVMMQELLLGGHLYLQILKEKLSSWLYNLRFAILKRSKDSMAYTLTNQEVLNATKQAGLLQTAIETFLSTGNLSSHSGLGLMQDKGLTIVTENINRMRYMSHFKSVHRGQFFTTMRTTETRQLLPDAWGFICPVHTPDGAPCGLLNHLTMNCKVTQACDPKKKENIQNLLVSYGMKSLEAIDSLGIKESYVTVLDGKVLGYTPKKYASKIVQKLRIEKIQGENIPETTEIAFIEKRDIPTQYPGLYIFTGPSRMMRPVINLTVNKVELIGTLEQVYMSICVKPEEAYEGITTHMEISKTAFLSNLAKLIPMPDCNQSPRNMYQCQMGKQTMGTPIHNWKTLSDTKLYRLETPASPLFRPVHYDNIDLDHYPMGTNAFVAVISYTGYDMEDAMIINKSSYERGLAFGSIYKTEYIELPDNKSFFCRDPSNESIKESLDNDGFPHPGMKLHKDDPLYCYFDENQSKFVIHKSKETEEIMIDNIRIFGGFSIITPKKAAITYRIVRNPSVGDKFASRAGQKGICSKLWPAEDLPFTETGLIPDIVFNPHGFPSRMTIAMMIEVMAGKSASLHGLVHDATPFRFDEKDTAIDCFGKLLEAGGYNYYGTEPMYSGVNGRELKAHIFCGIVHYQRLRHMVSDKWQVRRTGPVDAITRQPVGGRRRGGGVRFGEMERDALMSHGASFLLQDRLFSCSDRSVQKMCKKCGSLLSPIAIITRRTDKPNMTESRDICKICQDDGEVVSVEIPYIFKYLVMELASINIHVKLQLKHS